MVLGINALSTNGACNRCGNGCVFVIVASSFFIFMIGEQFASNYMRILGYQLSKDYSIISRDTRD
jgi:hypothetical protein